MSEESKTVAVLEKPIQVLEYLALHPGGIPLNEIASGVSLNKSTVYRILHTLRLKGYVSQDSINNNYSLGGRLLIYLPFLSQIDISSVALPYMRDFSDQYGVSTSLALYDSEQSLTVDCYTPNTLSSIRVAPEIGYRAELYCCASGKAFLSCFSEKELSAYLSSHKFIPQTAHTLVNPQALKDDISLARNRGYSVEYRENEDQILSIAAPIRSAQTSLFAAITMMTLVQLIHEQDIPKLGEELKIISHKISIDLGASH